ncbi:unnamed protein product [Symbiodinium microadriaticum]|nr:unnamed protein product [Symbiodinium microadriaticum]
MARLVRELSGPEDGTGSFSLRRARTSSFRGRRADLLTIESAAKASSPSPTPTRLNLPGIAGGPSTPCKSRPLTPRPRSSPAAEDCEHEIRSQPLSSWRKPQTEGKDFALNLSRKPTAASDANSREGSVDSCSDCSHKEHFLPPCLTGSVDSSDEEDLLFPVHIGSRPKANTYAEGDLARADTLRKPRRLPKVRNTDSLLADPQMDEPASPHRTRASFTFSF